MTDDLREAGLTAAFVRLADTLTVDYDILDVLDTLVRKSVELLGSDAGGLMIADPSTEQLRLVASTSHEAAFVETNQLTADAGPCIDCFTTGLPVSVGDIATEGDRWPAFRDAALQNGYHSMHAFPLKLRGTVVGALNLFSAAPGHLSGRDVAAGQALADVATIGILQARVLQNSIVVTDQLQRALDTRIVIEQAKGIIAHSADISTEEAFTALRRYARDRRLRLGDVAAGVAARTIVLGAEILAES